MSKRKLEIIGIVIALIACVVGIISLYVFYIYPTYIENSATSIVSHPFQFGVFDNGPSNLGITIKNIGKAHFMSCIKIESSNESINILRDYDCYEFFNNGETYEPQFIINTTALFKNNPLNFTLKYKSNTGWEYNCLFVSTGSNFYSGQSCSFPILKNT